MNTNEFLELTQPVEQTCNGYHYQSPRPHALMADGTIISIQASETHYCIPRCNQGLHYSEVELGYPSVADDILLPFAEKKECPTKSVYGYVPIEVVDAFAEKHGGIVGIEKEDAKQ